MQNENIRSKKIINAIALSFMIGLVILVAACNDEPTPTNGTTSTNEAPSSVAVAPAVAAASMNFHYLKIDSALLVDSFFKKIAAPGFKKIIFNFKVLDYTNFPRSITLMAHGATPPHDDLDYNPEQLDTLTNFEAISIDNLLYSTMELSRARIENLIGNPLSPNPAHRKSFTHLVFIPDIQTKNGQRHLYYKVQKRPIDPSAQEPTENLNPCPPFKPND